MVNKLRFYIRTVLSIAIVIVGFAFNVIAVTDVSSIPTGSTTWSDDTIRVMNSLTIDENSILTIVPGTVVSFQGKYKFIVRGTLIAQGTIADSIVFTAINEIPGWHGIRFINTNPAADSSIISFCRIQYGYASSGLMPDTPTNDDRGGAFYIDGFSKIRISNCLITNNKADDKGGAMFLYDGANPIIRNNTIVYNESYADAAGIACFLNCSPKITYNEIAFNTSIDTTTHPAEGGGIFCRDNSNAYIFRNNIHHNYADYGGGIWVTGSDPNIISNTIVYNECVSETELCLGAGILVKEDAAPKIVSNTICNNYTSYAGGGIFLKDTAVAFVSNNLICNNQSDSLGAGFFISNNSNAKIYNNTIANNHCAANGGAFRISASNPELVNNIIWGNTATRGNQIYLADDASDPVIKRCFVQGGKGDFGGSGSGISYEGSYIENIDFNPFFINPSESSGTGYDGLNADWAITAESPAIDNGYDSFNVDSVQTSIDVYGQTRFYNTIIDIGASEFQGDGLREYIFKDIYSNTVWSDSLYVISDIIIDSAALLTVQQNAYINFLGPYKISVDGIIHALGTEDNSIEFTSTNSETGWKGVKFENTSNISDTSRFSYCVFTNGKAFSDITDTIINSDDHGGSIFIKNYDNVEIRNSKLYNNTANERGGAIYLSNAKPRIFSNLICNNTALLGGGVFCQDTSNAKIVNNIIVNNTSDSLGGGLYVSKHSDVILLNNTISNNQAYYKGGALYSSTSKPLLVNNILWGDTAVNGKEIYLADINAIPEVFYNIIKGDKAAIGGPGSGSTYNWIYFTDNQNYNPEFVNPTTNFGSSITALSADWSLKEKSPCINTGNPYYTADSIGEWEDYSSNPRIYEGDFDIVDMGAIEFQDNPSVTFVNGPIFKDRHWTTDTVCVLNKVQIENEKTLSIDPGTYVQFWGHYKINVQGRILAIGDEANPITFTVKDTTGLTDTTNANILGASYGGWHGIRFDSTYLANDTSKIIYCILEYGKAVKDKEDSTVNNNGTHGAKVEQGGAIFISYFPKVVIKNNIFRNNFTLHDAPGIIVDYVSDSLCPVITDNEFIDGIALDDAGAIRCQESSPLISGNVFRNNHSNSQAGAIYCVDFCNPVITNNVFEYNSSDGDGGAIICSNQSNALISNNIIRNNSSGESGGGILLFQMSNPVIKNNTISENTALDAGGGIGAKFFSCPYIYNNKILSNHADSMGGGIYLRQFSDPFIHNSVLCDNSTNGNGGGIYAAFSSSPKVYNSTIADNSAFVGGGFYCETNSCDTIDYEGLYILVHSTPIFINSIIFDNYAYDIDSGNTMYLKGFSYPSLRYCLVDGGFYSIKQEEGYEFAGIYENNIDSDPMFLKEGDEYYSLQNSSQCIDMGCPDTTFMDLPPTDLIGCDRIFDGNDNGISRIDIGAYEFGSPFIGIQEYGEANENGLIQNFPNPFYDFTTISFSLMEDSEVLIIIYDRSGRKLDELVNDKMHRGDYIFEWNSDKIQPGIYFCVLKTELKTQTIKLCKMN